MQKFWHTGYHKKNDYDRGNGMPKRYCWKDTSQSNQIKLQKAFEDKFPLREIKKSKPDSYATCEKEHEWEMIQLPIASDVSDELIDFTFEWMGL